MLDILDILTKEREIEIAEALEPRTAPNPDGARQTSTRISGDWARLKTNEIHPRVFKLMTSLFIGILAAFAAVFASDGETLFMIAICAFYGAMYFGVAPIMLRMKPQEHTQNSDFVSFLSGLVETNTGRISGRAALMQICAVPAALFLCALGMAVIIATVQ